MPSSVESLPESSTLSDRSSNAEETKIVCKSKSLECNVTSRLRLHLLRLVKLPRPEGILLMMLLDKSRDSKRNSGTAKTCQKYEEYHESKHSSGIKLT